MQTIKHSRGGPDIEGVRLAPNTVIEKGDLFSASSGLWEQGGVHVGGRVPAGDHVIWVRPAPSKTS